MILPPIPLDDTSLSMIESALTGTDRTSVSDLLDLWSQMAGSDPHATAPFPDDMPDVDFGPDAEIVFMRDPMYSQIDLIAALVAEIRRLRA